jgi:excisionase family DNA binding protein
MSQTHRPLELRKRPSSANAFTEPPPLLSVDQVAGTLAISSRHLRNLIAKGEVRAIRLGRAVRVPRAEVDRIVGIGETAPRA